MKATSRAFGFLEALEVRQLLFAAPAFHTPASVDVEYVHIAPDHIDQAVPGDVWAEVSRINLDGTGISRVSNMTFVPMPGSDPLLNNVQAIRVTANLDHNPDFETVVGSSLVNFFDYATIEPFRRGIFVSPWHHPQLKIEALIYDNAFHDDVTLGVGTVIDFEALGGMPDVDIDLIGVPQLFELNAAPMTANVMVRAMLAEDTAVLNQKNVPLMRFEVFADGGDMLSTAFAFKSSQGILHQANNYSLWVDSNGDGDVDTVIESGVSVQMGRVMFDGLNAGGWVTPEYGTTVFEVRADVASSLVTKPTSTLQLTFHSPPKIESLSDGSSVDVNLTNGLGTLYKIRSQGDVYVSKSPTPTFPQYLLGGTSNTEVLRLRFDARYEGIDVSRLTFNVVGGSNVEQLLLFRAGETTPFAQASPATGYQANLTSSQLGIPHESTVEILVKPVIPTDQQGSVSGGQVQVSLVGVQARGNTSLRTLSTNDGDALAEGEVFLGRTTPGPNANIVGNTFTVTHSKVTNIINANPDANGTAIPTGTDRAIGQFRFTAASHTNGLNGLNKVKLQELTFRVNAVNVSLNGFAFFNKANPINKSTDILVTDLNGNAVSGPYTGSLLVTVRNLSTSVVNTLINSGSDGTFVLEADVLNGKVNPSLSSSLQVGLLTQKTKWYDHDNLTDTLLQDLLFFETTVNSTMYNG